MANIFKNKKIFALNYQIFYLFKKMWTKRSKKMSFSKILLQNKKLA